MSGKLHLICMKTEGFHAKIRCNFPDIPYLSETQKNNFQFLSKRMRRSLSIGGSSSVQWRKVGRS